MEACAMTTFIWLCHNQMNQKMVGFSTFFVVYIYSDNCICNLGFNIIIVAIAIAFFLVFSTAVLLYTRR